MTRLDLYILKLLVGACGFFTLIYGGVIWLTQTVKLVDIVIASGGSALTFLEFSLYVLPTVMGLVIPLAAFSAALYVLNRLYTEAELVVMMMSGKSAFGLARPIGVFAGLTMIATLLVTLVFAPDGVRRLTEGRTELRTAIASVLIREGQFLHPFSGVTAFIRSTGSNGQMAGMFLHDQRDPRRPVTYSAERAFLLRDEIGARLVLANGVSLTYDTQDQTLSQVRFDEFVYDLTPFLTPSEPGPPRPEIVPLRRLFDPTPEMLSARYTRGDYLAAAHERLATGLTGLVLPLLALAVILTGSYQRRGFGARILGAIVLGVLVLVATIGSKSLVVATPAIWPIMYLPSIAGLALTAGLLARATFANPTAAPA